MPNRTATHASEKDSATARKPQRGARASGHQTEQVNRADAPARALNAPATTLVPADILALQRSAGNHAVEQMLIQRVAQQDASPLTIQAKLAVGAADDPYAREADRVAAIVMQTSESSVPHIQRQSDEEDEEETHVQRRAYGEQTSVDPEVERGIEKGRGGGQPLHKDVRVRMEQAFGADFGAVRVHTDAESDGLARSLQSVAFTTGHHLFFKSGEYSPHTRSGQEVIAHELTHVLQQKGGQVGHSSEQPSATQHSRGEADISSLIQSTQVQLQTKKSYAVLDKQFTGQSRLRVRKKNKSDNCHVTIVDRPPRTYTFEDFHVTFENNVKKRQAHLFYSDLGIYQKPSKDHPQNPRYDEDVKTKGLPTRDALKPTADQYAKDFLSDLKDAEAQKQKEESEKFKAEKEEKETEKQKAEAAKTKAVKEKLAQAKDDHNGFKVVLKERAVPNAKPAQNAALTVIVDTMKKKIPDATVTAALGQQSAQKASWGQTICKINLDIKLADFKKNGESAYTTLMQDAETVETTKLA